MCCATVHVICFLVAHNTFNPHIRFCSVVVRTDFNLLFLSRYFIERRNLSFITGKACSWQAILSNFIDPLFREAAFCFGFKFGLVRKI